MNFFNNKPGFASRKQLKRIFLVCSLLSVILNVWSVHAEGLNEGNPDGTPTAEQDAENERDLARLEQQDEIEVNYPATLNIPVTKRRQERKNWCGPACVQMAIHYKTGTLISQSTIASYVINSNGNSEIYRLKNYLNNHISGNHYVYRKQSNSSIENYIKSSISKGYPILVSVKAAILSPGSYTDSARHIILIRGYTDKSQIPTQSHSEAHSISSSGSSLTVSYIDPFDKKHLNINYEEPFNPYGVHSVSIDTMIEAMTASNGYYIYGN